MFPKTKWLVLWSLWLARMVPQPSPVVHVEQGALRGRLTPDGSQYQFFGIPYATSDSQYRFKAPGPEPKWKGVYDAINEHIKCPQRYGPWLVLGYENCLILNVYRPVPMDLDAPLPVMVYIHGGGFKEGSGSRLLYGPDYLVTRGIVLVTINYRLDLEGFLCLGIKEAPGNAGMKDQVAALKWVQRNIRAFGGDPDNVTIFGESAGGTSVSLHLLSPLSRGLYHKAIIQSGSSVAPWGLQHKPLQNAIATAKELGFDSVDTHQLYKFFMNETITNLLKAEIPKRDGQLAFLRLVYMPCIERKINESQPFLTDSPFDMLSRGEYNKVPIVIGATDHEGYYFASFENEQSLKNIRFEETLPLDLYFPTESERLAVGEQVKQLYVGDEQMTWYTIVKLSLLLGEPYFTYPVQAETELLLQASDHPAVYSYMFEYSGWRNFAKFVGSLKFWGENGASHADDLFYMFSLFPVPSMFEHHMINTMTTLWTNFSKYGLFTLQYETHLGPVRTLERNPGFLKNFLTVGDWTARVWSEECRESAVIWSPPHRHKITHGAWSPTRLSLIMLVQANGVLALWDILRRQYEPVLTVQVCEEPLLQIKPHDLGSLVACGSVKGNIYMMEVSNSLSQSARHDKGLMTVMLEREAKREKILEAKLREIRLKLRTGEEGEPLVAVTSMLDTTIGDKDLQEATAEYFTIAKKEIASM